MKKLAHSKLALLASTVALVAEPVPALAIQGSDATVSTSEVCRTVMTQTRQHGSAFYRRAPNSRGPAMTPTELAGIIRVGLNEDRSGMTKVRPAQPGDQANATPMQWFCALKARDPRATNLASVADLPGYLEALVARDPPRDDRMRSGCITPSGKVLLDCVVRAFRRGEQVWVNAQTAVSVIQQDCANVIKGPEFPERCYVFQHNYYQQRNVRWRVFNNQNHALVSTHMSFTEEQMSRVYADDCYFVEDENGRYKPRPDCPFAFCPPGSRWPTVVGARAVGLPDGPPETTIHYWLANGRGRVSIPMWAARILAQDDGDFIPCVYVKAYPASVTGLQGWTMFSRFDRAQGPQIRPTLNAGRYSEVFQGRVRF